MKQLFRSNYSFDLYKMDNEYPMIRIKLYNRTTGFLRDIREKGSKTIVTCLKKGKYVKVLFHRQINRNGWSSIQ